jgi:hypothetical protein
MRKLAIDALRHTYEAQKKNAEYTYNNCKDDLNRLNLALASWIDADQKLAAMEELENDFNFYFDK